MSVIPAPEETLALQERVRELLEKNRTDGLSAAEEDEWQRYEHVEHLVRIAKATAAIKLKTR